MTGHTAAAGLDGESEVQAKCTRGRCERCGQCASRSAALRPSEGPGFGGCATAMKVPGRGELSVLRTRRYLTGGEVERLIEAARKHGRYGHRDATMILIAYRHGPRACELCDLQWHQVELNTGHLHHGERRRCAELDRNL